MRIWSIHPKYLDAKGLVALWREALLAKHVLEDKTKGYKNHPQLERFRQSANPLDCMNYYLSYVYEEASSRGYKFDRSKVNWNFSIVRLTVNKGQLIYETSHYFNKLKVRDEKLYLKLLKEKEFSPHPIFTIVEGEIESWETVKSF